MDNSSTMRAAQASAFGKAHDVLTISDNIPRPKLPTKGGYILVRVHAVSLSPSDYRMLSGDADLVKKPPGDKWPYIPGGDVCGVVEAVQPGEAKFRVGDAVIGTWDVFGIGGIAEYTLVETRYAELLPKGMSFLHGAALADSAVNGMLAVQDAKIGSGDRVLVLGGSGAVGSTVIQLAKDAGASYVATTSTDTDLCTALGADLVVNYRETEWSELAEFRETPFDVVVDCAEGVSAWRKVLEHEILKPSKRGGRFLAVVVNEWHIEIHTCGQMMSWFGPVLWRVLANCFNRDTPSYKMMFPSPRGDSLPRLLKLVEEKRVRVVVDPRSPFEFNTKGVREAFDLMTSRGAHGKVVISIRDE